MTCRIPDAVRSPARRVPVPLLLAGLAAALAAFPLSTARGKDAPSDWHDDYFAARIPVETDVRQAGRQTLAIDPAAVTEWINETAEFPFETQAFAHDAVRLVANNGAPIEGAFQICPGAELLVNGGFESVTNGLPAGWKLTTREGFAVEPSGNGHVLAIQGGDLNACYQEIPLASNTWYRFAYRAKGKNGPSPCVVPPSGSGWTPVERSAFDPVITHDTWRERVIYFHTGDKRRWGADRFSVRILRFDGQVDDLSLRPCRVAFVAELPETGRNRAWLYYSPYEGPLPAPPGIESAAIPATTAGLKRTGTVEWLDDRLSRAVGGSDAGELWWVPTTRKWKPGDRPPAARAEAIRLACARNEAEPVQLLFNPRTPGRLEAVDVRLTGPGDTPLPPGCFDVRLGHYVPITSSSTYAYGTLERASRFGYTGRLPDPLTAFAPLDVDPAQPPVPIWIDIAVPADARPGSYRGTVTVRAGGRAIEVPLLLEVWDFVLPTRPTCRTAFGLDQYANQFLFPFHKAETREDKYALSRAYIAASVRYKVSPKGVASPYHHIVDRPPDFRKVETVLDAYRSEVPWGLDEVQATSLLVAHWSGPALARDKTEADGRIEAQRLDRIAAWLETGGWLDRAFVWIDEPRPNAYAMLKTWVGLLKEQPHARKLKIFPLVYNGDAYEGLGDVADMMAFWDGEYPASTFSPEYARRADRTFEPWCYYTRCVHQWIDAPGMNQRLWAPKVFAMGGRGMAMWAMLQWWSYKDSPHATHNPWVDPSSTWGNGALAFFYPPNPLGTDLPARDMAIVPSLRLLLTRDGIDDFEYGVMLERIVQTRRSEKIAAEAEAVLAAMRRPFVSPVHWTLGQTYWRNVRERAGAVIASAAGPAHAP